MNEGRTIPMSELGLQDDSTVVTLSSDDIYKLLAVQIRRGLNISSWLFVFGAVGAVVTVIWSRNWIWAIPGVVVSAAFKTLAMLSHEKLKRARHVAMEPGIVYWAHTCHSITPRYFEVCLTLHMRTGRSLELTTSREKAKSIVSWLRQQNTDIRIGEYDSVPETKNRKDA